MRACLDRGETGLKRRRSLVKEFIVVRKKAKKESLQKGAY